METFIIVAYCASDDARKNLGLDDNAQTKVGMAQIMTVALVAARFFGGNHKIAQDFLYKHRYFHHKLSSSQFNRRFHQLSSDLTEELFRHLAKYAKMANESYDFAIDSFPIQACQNARIARSRLFDPKGHRGFMASKRSFFHGVRVHMIATTRRMPVEFKILPGAISDIKAAQSLCFDLPTGSTVFADKGYASYKFEDELKKSKNIELAAIRKKNSSRARDPQEEGFIRRKRKTIETTFSLITKLIPKTIHAVTQKGFLKKIYYFVFAYSLSCMKVTT